jgi:hypothetical protein
MRAFFFLSRYYLNKIPSKNFSVIAFTSKQKEHSRRNARFVLTTQLGGSVRAINKPLYTVIQGFIDLWATAPIAALARALSPQLCIV